MESVRVNAVKRIQFSIFQNICVNLRNPIDAVTIMNGYMRHMDPVLSINNLYPGLLILFRNPCVQFLYDGNYLGNCLFNIGQGPFFQCLGQNGMIGIGAGIANHLDSLIHCKTFFQSQNTYQFRNDKGGMGIVDLNCGVFCHTTQIAALFLQFFQYEPGSVGAQKILLVDSQ